MKLDTAPRGIAHAAALVLLLCGGAAAQNAQPPAADEKKPSVAQLRLVEGNVLVSGEAGLASAEEATRLVEGSRVITTAESTVIVVYDDGCEVKLKPNQRLEVDDDQPCRQRLAQAHSIFLEPGGIGLAAGSAGAAGSAAAAVLAGTVPAAGLAAGTGLAGVAALVSARQNDNTSPN